MSKRTRPSFSPAFRLESAQLVLDQGYTVKDAADAMNIGKSTMDKWVRQLKEERDGISPKATPMTPDQLKIRELEKKIHRIEEEKETLKKATVISRGSATLRLIISPGVKNARTLRGRVFNFSEILSR